MGRRAPTARELTPPPAEAPATEDQAMDVEDDNDDVLLDVEEGEQKSVALLNAVDSKVVESESMPKFVAPSKDIVASGRPETRKIPVPPNRMTPLKNQWESIFTALVEKLKLQVRMNIKSKAVELRSSKQTEDGAMQKGEDFVRAFLLGFDVRDAMALINMDGIYIISFELKDIKTIKGDHEARAIGRVCGKGGKVKFAIENSTRTRIVVAGSSKIHILGGYREANLAQQALVKLIRGTPPGQAVRDLQVVAARMKERF